MSLLNTILNNILNTIFPIRCIACGKFGEDLCIACIRNIPTAERESAKWIFPVFDYRHPPLKKALWLLKYNGKKRIANVFADILYGKILEELSDLSVMQNFTNSILIPIPLSSKRYRDRGYNQAELICQALVKLDRENIFELNKTILIKAKHTPHQARLKDRRIRLKNLEGSYGVKNSELIKGRNIILIDDITTTGATLNEARKILKEFGARKVIAFTVAH